MLGRRSAALALVAAFLLVGCTAGHVDSPEPSALITTAPPVTDDPGGAWGERANGGAWVEFFDDGTMTGSDGCNGYGGNWAMSGGTVTFSEVASTLKACIGSHTVPIGPVATAIVEGDVIRFFDEQGYSAGMLTRS